MEYSLLPKIRSYPLLANHSIHPSIHAERVTPKCLDEYECVYGSTETGKSLLLLLSSDLRWLILISVSLTGAISLGEEV